jgi:hypothetical protein
LVGFFNTYRRLYPVSGQVLGGIADRFQQWLRARSEKRSVPVLDAPSGRRDDFVEPYFRGAKPDEVVVVLKGHEPARIMVAIGDKTANRWHLQFAQRWVVQYNFYVNDRQWGRMFVRICPYLPFSARVYLNQHHWLANRMREEGIDFRQCANAFVKCTKPDRLQELADLLTPRDLVTCGQKWLARFTPFFTATEREHAGCQHRLFFAQVAFCDNLVFRRRAALDKLGARLLDANRTIGQPNKITTIFGRKITKRHRGKLQTPAGSCLACRAVVGVAKFATPLLILPQFLRGRVTQGASAAEATDSSSVYATCEATAPCAMPRSIPWSRKCDGRRIG